MTLLLLCDIINLQFYIHENWRYQMGKSEKKSLHVLLEDKQIENLETYMKAKGLENRSQAIRHLLNNIEEYINKKD